MKKKRGGSSPNSPNSPNSWGSAVSGAMVNSKFDSRNVGSFTRRNSNRVRESEKKHSKRPYSRKTELIYKGEGPTVRLLVEYYNLWYDNTKPYEEKQEMLDAIYLSMVNTLVKRENKLESFDNIGDLKGDLPIDPLKLRRLKDKFKSLAKKRPFFYDKIWSIVYSMQQGEIRYFGGRYKRMSFPTYLVTDVIPYKK